MMNNTKGASLLVFVLTILFLAPLTHHKVFKGGNDASRFAQMESLVDYGHTYIDESIYSGTIDRVRIGDKVYSNKPPVLSIIGAGAYYLLKKTGGITFAGNEAVVVYLLVMILVVIPTAWLVSLFYSSLEQYRDLSFRSRCLATLALAAGTILTSFSVTLNNHTVAAALLFAAFNSARQGQAVKTGVWSALAVCIDIVPGLLFIPYLAYRLYSLSGRRALARYCLLLSAGAAVFVAGNIWIVGHPLPPKLVPGAIDFSSEFGPSAAGVLLPDAWTYPLEALLGWHGFFAVSPVLIFGVLGLGRALKAGGPLPRTACIVLSATLAVIIGGHILFVGSYGGWSYGFRYLIPIIPVLMFFAPVMIEKYAGIFTGILALSVLFAVIGTYNPWPPGYTQELHKDPVASLVKNPIGANAAAWMEQYFPDSVAAGRMKALVISPSERSQIQYLMLFYYSKSNMDMAISMRQRYR
ncbi:MAG: hypothetical protein ACYC69_02105 [Thermodesulfovibrionales bacterium]